MTHQRLEFTTEAVMFGLAIGIVLFVFVISAFGKAGIIRLVVITGLAIILAQAAAPELVEKIVRWVLSLA